METRSRAQNRERTIKMADLINTLRNTSLVKKPMYAGKLALDWLCCLVPTVPSIATVCWCQVWWAPSLYMCLISLATKNYEILSIGLATNLNWDLLLSSLNPLKKIDGIHLADDLRVVLSTVWDSRDHPDLWKQEPFLWAYSPPAQKNASPLNPRHVGSSKFQSERLGDENVKP